MSIPTNTGNASVTYEGDGTTALFTIPFTFSTAAEIAVYLNGALAVGVTVYDAGNPFGGTVTFATAPAIGDIVRIRRLQTVHVSDNDTTADTLAQKLVAGSNITLTEQNDGGNETLRIDVANDLETCKVWVNFNGIGTVAIRDSFNVSSITDLGTGDYMVNYDTPFATVDYCALFGSDWYTPVVRGDVYDVDKARVSNFGYLTYYGDIDCKFGLFTGLRPTMRSAAGVRDAAAVLQSGTPFRILYEERGDQGSLLRIVVPAPRFVAALMHGGLVRRRRVAGYNADRSPVWDGDGVLLGPMSETEAIAFIAWKDVPAHVNRREIVSIDQLPTDRTYRNAWRLAS